MPTATWSKLSAAYRELPIRKMLGVASAGKCNPTAADATQINLKRLTICINKTRG